MTIKVRTGISDDLYERNATSLLGALSSLQTLRLLTRNVMRSQLFEADSEY